MGTFSVEKQEAVCFEEVDKLFRYNPTTGEFIWREDRGPARAGCVAGWIGKQSGYAYLKIGERDYAAHRVAWLFMTGGWPTKEIDHKDTNRSNNRWANLREAKHGQNQSNSKLYKNNRLGFKGVSTIPTRPDMYRARIRKDGREISLGVWPSPEQAHAAYIEAAKKYHGDFWRV